MPKQVDYIVIEANSKTELTSLVQGIQKLDFDCQGGIAMILNGLGQTIYAQAMVKYDE